MKRVTYKSANERKNSQFQDLPKLKDILVDLKITKENPKVVRKLRLVGTTMAFTEFTAKKRIPKEQQTKNKYFEEVAFPDAEKNPSYSRIGNDDPSKCYWKANNYIGTKKFAVKVLEEQEDGSWAPKVLCKGPSVFNEFFNWEGGRVEENLDSGTKLSTCLGGDKAPAVRITASYVPDKLGNVEYKVHVASKDMPITEDFVNILRAVREPSADELNQLRAEYAEELEQDPSLPEWHDWYEYSHDLRRIFQYTPPKLDDTTTESVDSPSESEESGTESASTEEEIDIENLDW
jgi:hypothetical protein